MRLIGAFTWKVHQARPERDSNEALPLHQTVWPFDLPATLSLMHSAPSELTQAVPLLTCILDALDSNLG
jgi:hypothetical protein